MLPLTPRMLLGERVGALKEAVSSFSSERSQSRSFAFGGNDTEHQSMM